MAVCRIVCCATLIVWVLFLCPPCYCGGGQGASSVITSPTFDFVVGNRFLWELTRDFPSRPSSEELMSCIAKLSELLGITINLTRSVASIITKRAAYLRVKSRNLRGGRQHEAFFSRSWTITLSPCDFSREVDVVKENEILKGENKALRQQLQASSDTIRRIQEGVHGRGKRKDSECEYSDRHLRRLKKHRASSSLASLTWLEQEGLKPLELEVYNINSGKKETIKLNSIESVLSVEEGSVDDEQRDIISMMVYVKDRYNVSGSAYHEMAKLCREMPRHYRLQRRIAELNSLWKIKPTPNGVSGVQQSLKDRLLVRLTHLIESTPPNASYKVNKQIKVKLSGDGTSIGKRLHVVNFTFTLLDEGDKAYSYEGNHSLAIFKDQESYEGLKSALEDIIQEVKKITKITVMDSDFNIEYFLGGDWKFLAVVTGIDSATSTYPCIWCKCPKDKRHDLEKKWSLLDEKQGRSTEENFKIGNSKGKKKFNVSHPPLFCNIPFKNVVIDNLHLFLRVADRLIDLLLTDLKRLDAIDRCRAFSNFKISSYKHLATYEAFVTSLGIPGFAFYIGKTSKQLKCRTLTGTEKLKLFSNIKIADLLPTMSPAQTGRIQHLWDEFLRINTILSKKPEEMTQVDIDSFEEQARSWGRDFLQIYHDNNITPYIHALANHVGEFLTLHGSLLPFTQQGLEKYNDITTKHYFRATNHKGTQAFMQIMQKQNRIEYLNDSGLCSKKKYVVKCGNCRQEGHSIRTCSKPCNNCGHTPHHKHLNKVDSHFIPLCSSGVVDELNDSDNDSETEDTDSKIVSESDSD